MKKHIAMMLTIDIEGEWFALPGEQGTFDINKILAAVNNLEQLLDSIEIRIGSRIPITWFIRCDDSVAAATGEEAGLLNALDDFIQRRASIGDEFGFHPHLYCHSNGKWVPESKPDRQQEQIERAANAWKTYFGLLPRLSRMGEAVMNNTLAACLSKLGIEIDSSALPDRKRFDNGFQFDWTGTPTLPYNPSVYDYRRPANDGETAHSFVEIPFTMLPIMGREDKAPIKRYCNLAFKPELIKMGAKLVNNPENIIAVVHPHELLYNGNDHPLIAYNPASLEENIVHLTNIYCNLDFTVLTTCFSDVNK